MVPSVQLAAGALAGLFVVLIVLAEVEVRRLRRRRARLRHLGSRGSR